MSSKGLKPRTTTVGTVTNSSSNSSVNSNNSHTSTSTDNSVALRQLPDMDSVLVFSPATPTHLRTADPATKSRTLDLSSNPSEKTKLAMQKMTDFVESLDSLPPRLQNAAANIKALCATYGVKTTTNTGRKEDVESNDDYNRDTVTRTKLPTIGEIVSFSQGSVSWVEAWYALRHRKKKIKFSKDKCELTKMRAHCPDRLNRCVAPVDDAFIKCSQSCARVDVLAKPFAYLAYFFTATTVVELAPVIPVVLYGCFLDDIALMSLVVVTAVFLLSQIPKRYCWRYRPFYDFRAVHFKSNTTSSFPSRAVVCAVAYSYVVALCVANGPDYFTPLVRTLFYLRQHWFCVCFDFSLFFLLDDCLGVGARHFSRSIEPHRPTMISLSFCSLLMGLLTCGR